MNKYFHYIMYLYFGIWTLLYTEIIRIYNFIITKTQVSVPKVEYIMKYCGL